jgi:hypothetical protein
MPLGPRTAPLLFVFCSIKVWEVIFDLHSSFQVQYENAATVNNMTCKRSRYIKVPSATVCLLMPARCSIVLPTLDSSYLWVVHIGIHSSHAYIESAAYRILDQLKMYIPFIDHLSFYSGCCSILLPLIGNNIKIVSSTEVTGEGQIKLRLFTNRKKPFLTMPPKWLRRHKRFCFLFQKEKFKHWRSVTKTHFVQTYSSKRLVPSWNYIFSPHSRISGRTEQATIAVFALWYI